MKGGRNLPWWMAGLIGAAVLSIATLFNLIRALVRGAAADADWSELPGFAALLGGMGFACGLVTWAALGLSRVLGRLGDALVGLIVMNIFFLMCMVAFDRAMLADPAKRVGAAWMFALATVTGLILGVWVGHDLRKELKE